MLHLQFCARIFTKVRQAAPLKKKKIIIIDGANHKQGNAVHWVDNKDIFILTNKRIVNEYWFESINDDWNDTD